MEFKYPKDLIKILKERWFNFQKTLDTPSKKFKKQKDKDFPNDRNLKTILNVIYHASFLTEESRRIAYRIGYVSPEKCEQKISDINMISEPIKLLIPVPFTVQEILKIAPSVNPNQSLVLISEGDKIQTNLENSELYIWGILDLGSEWWEVVSGLSSAAMCPPNILTVSSTSPGNITVTTIGSVLFRLSAGKILGTPLEDLSLGLIGGFLDNSAKALYSDSVKRIKVEKYDEREDSDKYPYQTYYQTFNSILNFAKDKLHGATFIVIPDEINYNDTRLTDRINIKYIFDKDIIWDKLIDLCEANYFYYKTLFYDKFKMILDKRKASPKELKDLIKWENSKQQLEKKIIDIEKFIAQLSCVDGAVVLTSKLRIIGYGGEILAQSSSLTSIKSANDPDAKSYIEVDINNFGTRHRSAFRMCSSFDNCVAFVISQDGGIKAVKRNGPNLILWNNVNLGETSI
ncbi:MAG: DNA integrity scanning protein DisA nucleotide-binding domain protein [Ignavibacteriales bacterium]|nr:MAG: DNA integrity scanning protein DisA nucleotide-binding domain protein [Ignavibacteriales bacterium]